MKRALIVIGKAPRAGQCKTRLVPPLTPRRAAKLYTCFLLDCIDLAKTIADVDVYLLYAPRPGAARKLKAVLPAHVKLLPQVGHGIGEGSAYGFRVLLSQGYPQVVLIGSDNPTLPPNYLQDAYSGLQKADLAFGPTYDGGYYLIGMTKPHLGVFEQIAWSTELVEEQVRARAAELGLCVHDVPRWYDVDSVNELRRLLYDVQRDGASAPRTKYQLQHWLDDGTLHL